MAVDAKDAARAALTKDFTALPVIVRINAQGTPWHDADMAAVKAAYRRFAKDSHPDVRPGDKDAAVRFQQVQAAYAVLTAADEARTAA